MIRLIWRTDAHLSDHAPASRKDDWTAAVFEKLEQIRMVAGKLNVAGILDGGDFFHTKSPTRNSHRLVRMVADHHATYPCPVFCTPGNHDSVYGDYSFLDQQPLGVLYSSGVFQRLYDEFEVYFGPADTTTPAVKAYPYNRKEGGFPDGNPFYFRNQHQVGDIPVVRVVGIPYHGSKYDLQRLQNIKKGEEDYLVCVAHVLASPQGGTMFEAEDVWSYNDLSAYAPDIFCFLPGTAVSDEQGCAFPIENASAGLLLQGRDAPTVIEQVHPVREVDTEVVTLAVEGVPPELLPGVTTNHPFWVIPDLLCHLPSRSTRQCHPDKGRASYPCNICGGPHMRAPRWVNAGDIRKGDYVAVPYPKVPLEALDAPGLARLLGYYAAEGNLLRNRHKEPVAGVSWSFCSDEHFLHDDVRLLVQEHFHRITKEYSHVKYGTKALTVRAHGREIAAFFGGHCPGFAPTKTLSPWVWQLSANSRLELLVGWMLGDGHARHAKTEAMGGTTSPRLAQQMFLLALSIGLRPYYTINFGGVATFSDGTTSPKRPFHCITFYGDDAVMLSLRMGVCPPERVKTKVVGFFQDGLFWRRVRQVSHKHYRGPVYNMRTSTGEYVAGLLLTHNCLGHWHKDQGAVSLHGKQIVNIGSLTRGALTQDEMDRRPAVALLSFTRTTAEVKVARLKVKPPEEVFDLDARVRAEARTMTMDAFVASVRSTLVDSGGSTLEETVGNLQDVSEKVREKALLYLERAR